ncbi:trypsin-like peptidase domain-containing protein [Actinoplanes sp. KI2]|uniref:S1C family serine protease n=1 Tax=Actinoplanes sp. KI2 TaxID=2983315 RepID=UPI0021D6037D|nr:trypsin-like peptidase domain-containing protein [Actinoplanes sp. KI2]MCU7728074.1 trypsin-like peptidase domain-containing protein [Actinoplanes sp. KI2]
MSEPATPPGPAESRRPSAGLLIAGGVVLLLVVGVVGGLIGRASASGDQSAEATCTATEVADHVLPSVVTVLTSNGSTGGNGSGEVVRDGGYVLTNDHVISPAGPAGTIKAQFSGGQTVPATVVGRAPRVDLAVLKVDPPGGTPLIAIGKSATLRVGQPVVALGAPLGLTGTVTAGIVSALGRDVPVPADNGVTAILPGAVQTDASINPGNSGGPLVNCAGDLIGVNTAIATVPNAAGQAGGGSVGIGFAIPVDVAMVVADELIAHGSYTPPSMGVEAVPVSPAVAEQFGVPTGMYLRVVTPGGPAGRAGLEEGDIVTGIDGRPMNSPESLFLAAVGKKPGDQVKVQYSRGGTAGTATVTLA